MQTAHRLTIEQAASREPAPAIRVRHFSPDTPGRDEVEHFIRQVFSRHHAAHVRAFAPNLMAIAQDGEISAAAGWRNAGQQSLFLERYLDAPVEQMIGKMAGQAIDRQRIVEVGHLASDKPGGSLQIILAMAPQLAGSGAEWVVFTATQTLIGIFTRLGLPLFALAKADAARLGTEAADWGRYYDSAPVVVAGRIQIALDRMGGGA